MRRAFDIGRTCDCIGYGVHLGGKWEISGEGSLDACACVQSCHHHDLIECIVGYLSRHVQVKDNMCEGQCAFQSCKLDVSTSGGSERHTKQAYAV